jgi:hypothetical protein
MAHLVEDELEGNTLSFYAHLVEKGKPVGPGEVTRGASLSSTSVAHAHPQKLESMGLVQRDRFGDYFAVGGAAVGGHLWLGRPRSPPCTPRA